VWVGLLGVVGRDRGCTLGLPGEVDADADLVERGTQVVRDVHRHLDVLERRCAPGQDRSASRSGSPSAIVVGKAHEVREQRVPADG